MHPAPWAGTNQESLLQALVERSEATDRRVAELTASLHNRDRERRNRSDSRDRDHRRRRRDQDRDRYRN